MQTSEYFFWGSEKEFSIIYFVKPNHAVVEEYLYKNKLRNGKKNLHIIIIIIIIITIILSFREEKSSIGSDILHKTQGQSQVKVTCIRLRGMKDSTDTTRERNYLNPFYEKNFTSVLNERVGAGYSLYSSNGESTRRRHLFDSSHAAA